MDAANLCEIEFDRPGSHPNPHMTPIDDGDHVDVDGKKWKQEPERRDVDRRRSDR